MRRPTTEDSGPGDAASADEVPEAPDGAADEAGTSDEPVPDAAESDEPMSDEPAPGEPVLVESEPDALSPTSLDRRRGDRRRGDRRRAAGRAGGCKRPGRHGAGRAGTRRGRCADREDVSNEPEAGTAPALPPAARPRLRPYLRRGAVALVAAGFVALGVGAFAWAAPSPEGANQRFVEAAQSQGHVVAPGEQETLVISAARKICDRRITHDTDQERRATALNSDEIAAVGTAFGADTRDFTTLALKTFCSS